MRCAVTVLPMADSAANTFRTPAPAKINLHLRVGPPTAGDGFHPLLSWMVTVGLFDNLEFTLVDTPGISLSCDDPAIPRDASNLVVKTASALLDMTRASGEARGRNASGVAAALQKRIPVGAGLGGGSSDGAFTLLALDRLLGLQWSPQQLSDFAAQFGSDLSFFFHGPSSVCTGRGQIVSPVSIPKPRWAVLILPGIHMATPAVYRRFDEMSLGDAKTLENQPDWSHWATLDALELLPLLINDLEAPAFSTRVARRIVRMSGSGSTLFTIFDDQDETESTAERLRLEVGVNAQIVEICPNF